MWIMAPPCGVVNFRVNLACLYAELALTLLHRFAAPLPKAKAIRFSSTAVLFQHENHVGLWFLSFRMANIRKHSLLMPVVSTSPHTFLRFHTFLSPAFTPQIQVLLAVPEGDSESANAALRFIDLEVEDMTTQVPYGGLWGGVLHILTTCEDPV